MGTWLLVWFFPASVFGVGIFFWLRLFLIFACLYLFIQGVSNRMPLGAVLCSDRIHGGTNGKVEDMESRDGEEETPAGEHEKYKDHGSWPQSGLLGSDFTI